MKDATKNQYQVQQHHNRHRYLSPPPLPFQPEEEAEEGQEANLLRKGSVVEVTSDEEGFKDAWFVATLIRLPYRTQLKHSSKKKNPNYNKAYVEYHNLISEKDASVRLREYVNAAFIRPLPPPLLQGTPSKSFELGDIVDAYYCDGWWKGVVCKLISDSRFLVAFQNPPHEIEFGLSDLRFRLEWVNGNWLLPVNLKAASVMFSVGKKVEISLDGYQDCWFPATILEETGKGIFRTQYQQIQDVGGHGEHLETIVDSAHIRPSPPHLKDKNFFLLEKVDAFHNYGWRSGLITKELPDCQYIVFFKQSNKERKFDQSELRPHMEWKDGKWFTSQDVSIPPDYRSNDDNTYKTSNMPVVAVSRCSLAAAKTTSMDKILYNLSSRANHAGRPSPCNGQPSGVAADIPSDFVSKDKSIKETPATVESHSGNPSNTNMNEAQSEERGSNVLSPNAENVRKTISKLSSSADQSSDNPSWGKRVKRKQMKVSSELDDAKQNTDGFTEVPVEKAALTSIRGKEGYAEGAADVEKEFMTIKTNLPVVIGLACDSSRSSRTEKSCQFTGQDSSKHSRDWPELDDKELHSVTVINQFELGEIAQKRRRGRPPRSATKGFDPSVPVVEVTTTMDAIGFSQECVTNGSSKKFMNSQMKQKRKTGMQNEGAEDSMKGQTEKHSQKRGRKRTINLNTVSQEHASSNATEWIQADCNSVRNDSEAATKDSSNNMSDDQPLSKWFEEMQAPASNDGSSKAGVSPPRNIEEHQCLPFIKNNVLWSTIESMEVFRKMPQKPHFHPLEECKESSREGLAVGFMVTFSGVVERVSKLQLDDSKVTMNDILETLVELESHGFDIQLIKDRVTFLLSGKEKQENLKNEMEQIDNEIGKHKVEKSRIEVEIDEINREISGLQGKLSVAESKKENEDQEIASLQSKKDGIKEGMNRIRSDLDALGTLI